MATPKKKPPADSRSKNRHKGTFVVRLPESLRTMVEAWSLHNKRTL